MMCGTAGHDLRLEPLDVERAVVAAGLRGVAHEDADVADLGHVLLALGVAVMVAGGGVDRCLDRREQARGDLVLLRVAGVGDVAGEQDRVGLEGRDALGGPRQRGLGGLVVEPDVGVAELGDEHSQNRSNPS